jgi:hypothetical protein
LAIWATWFLEFWKRKNSSLDHVWGVSEFEINEKPRAGFQGELTEGIWSENDFITITETEGKNVGIDRVPKTKYYSPTKRLVKTLISFIPIGIFIMMVIISSIALLTCRLVLQRQVGGTVGG